MIVYDEVALAFSAGNSSRYFWQKHQLELVVEEDNWIRLSLVCLFCNSLLACCTELITVVPPRSILMLYSIPRDCPVPPRDCPLSRDVRVISHGINPTAVSFQIFAHY